MCQQCRGSLAIYCLRVPAMVLCVSATASLLSHRFLHRVNDDSSFSGVAAAIVARRSPAALMAGGMGA